MSGGDDGRPKPFSYDPDKSVQGICPCGKTFLAGTHIGGTTGSVQHEVPPCPEFLEKSPEDYLAWVRISYSN